MPTKEQWDELHRAWLQRRADQEGYTDAMYSVLISMRPKEDPEAKASELPPFPDGCDRFRMHKDGIEFYCSPLDAWRLVKWLDRSRHDCANAAIAWFLRERFTGPTANSHDYLAASCWYLWREAQRA